MEHLAIGIHSSSITYSSCYLSLFILTVVLGPVFKVHMEALEGTSSLRHLMTVEQKSNVLSSIVKL